MNLIVWIFIIINPIISILTSILLVDWLGYYLLCCKYLHNGCNKCMQHCLTNKIRNNNMQISIATL